MVRSLHPGDFVRGLLYPLRGLMILRRHPGLARFWLPPIVLTAAAVIATLVLSVRYHDDVLDLLWHTPATGSWSGGLLYALHFVVRVLSLIVGIVLGLFVCIGLASVIAAPFNDALSEVVEEIETSVPAPGVSLRRVVSDLGRTLRVELLKIVLYVAVMGPLLVASWVFPGVGQLLYAVVGGLFTVLYLAVDYVDWPASRRGLSLRDRLLLLSVRPLLTLGFGCAVAGCLFVPLLNLCFMPLAVAGGTRLFLDLVEYAARTR